MPTVLNRLIVTQGNGPRTTGVIDQEDNATAALTNPREQLAAPGVARIFRWVKWRL